MEALKPETGSEFIENGKINWRSWVPFPEHFPEEIKKLLDDMAGFTELAPSIHGSDKLEMFDVFTKVAFRRGLITREEYLDIESNKHMAA